MKLIIKKEEIKEFNGVYSTIKFGHAVLIRPIKFIGPNLLEAEIINTFGKKYEK